MSTYDRQAAYRRVEDLHASKSQEQHGYDSGELLWESKRGQDGSERLRLAKKTFQGRAFLDLRIEWRGPEGWLPTKKGVSIRVSELAEFRDAIDRAMADLANRGGR